MEAIRQEKGVDTAVPELGAIHAVGGFCEHTVVAATGVTTTLKTWPDIVGLKIEPASRRPAQPIGGRFALHGS